MLLRLLPLFYLLLLPQSLLAQHSGTRVGDTVADECPVTRPNQVVPVVPPMRDLPKAPNGSAWFGESGLWVLLPVNGVWKGLPLNTTGRSSLFEQELVWSLQGAGGKAETFPGLIVTGERLGSPGSPLVVRSTTLGGRVTVGFPTRGCWQITGRFGDEELAFVVRVVR
jgi:hypothetical protein